MDAGTLYRLSAFATRPDGGNPAGVWVGDALPDAAVMQRIAANVGFSETAFVAPGSGPDRTVRYYSPHRSRLREPMPAPGIWCSRPPSPDA